MKILRYSLRSLAAHCVASLGLAISASGLALAQGPMGFAVDSVCRAGSCAPTAALATSDQTLPFRITHTTAAQGHYEITGFIRVGGDGTNCGGTNLFMVRYLGNSDGSTTLTQNVTLNFNVHWACTVGPAITQVNTTHPLAIQFSAHSFTAVVNSSAVYNGIAFPSRGPFSPPNSVQVSDFLVVPVAGDKRFASNTTYTARFNAGTPAESTIWMGFSLPVLDKTFASVLPTVRTSRPEPPGAGPAIRDARGLQTIADRPVMDMFTSATAFATIINTDTTAAQNCLIAAPTDLAGTFDYQTTNPATNTPTGTVNTPVSIPAGQSQSFVIAVRPNAELSRDLNLVFLCANKWLPVTLPGINSLFISANNTPLPDMISIAATPSGNGILQLPSTSGIAAFGTAAINIGAGGNVVVRPVDTAFGQSPRGLPVTATICRTIAQTGQCLNPPAATVNLGATTNQIVTFSVFVQGQGQVIPLDPARNRIHVVATLGAIPVGGTSVAIRTP